MKKNKHIWEVLWAFVKIDMLAFAIYLVSSILIQLIFYSDTPPGNRNFSPVYWFMHIIFFAAYYLIFATKINDEKIEVEKTHFSLKRAIVEFIHRDRLQIFFMISFAIIYEISRWVWDDGPNLVASITAMFVPSAETINIPIIRTCVGLSISLLSMLLSNIIIKYRKNKYWNG